MILRKSLSPARMCTWLELTSVLALMVGLAIFTGVERSSPTQGQKYTFYMVVGRGIAYPEAWTDLAKGVKEADEVYPDLDVIYQETDDFKEFLALVERAIAAKPKPDGLIVTTREYGLPEFVDPAIKRGIPVIMIGDIGFQRVHCEERPEISCIGEDPYQAGVMAAEESLKRFTPKLAAAVFEVDITSRERTYGFLSTMWRKGVEVGEFSVMQIDLLLHRLREFRGQETLVFVTITNPLPFIERFIQLAKEFKIELGPGGVRLVQVGVYPKAIEYIEKDKIMLAAIDQQWYLQGHLSVDGMYSYVKYGMRRPWVATQEVVTEDTIKAARELGGPEGPADPLGLLLGEMKGQPIRVVSNPCLCRPNPSFEISDATKKDELAKYFKDLPKATPPARALCGGFGIFNPALDRRLPFSYAHVASGVIKVPERVGKKTEYVYYKDKHGLEKWLKDLYKQSTGSQLKEPVYEDEQKCRKETDKPIWGLPPRSIRVYRNLFSGLPNPSFEISDPAEIDKLAEFFKDLPRTEPPARALWGGFLIFTGCLDLRLPGYTHVSSGIIKIGETYYKDIHGLEKWLEELCKRSTCDSACASIRTSSHNEPESASLPAQQLPTSGAEPPYNDELWNEPPYCPIELGRYLEGKATIEDRWVLAKHWTLEVIQKNNNCYNYADNIVTDTLAQPGRLGRVVIPAAYWVEDGKKIDGSRGDHTLAELCKKLEEATKADGLTVIDCTKVCPPSRPGGKPDSYKEMLFVGNYDAPTGKDRDEDGAMDRKWRDYHFYRQDKGGSWSHKPGQIEVTNRDAKGNPITDPRRADRKYEGLEYTEFCGCFCRGPNVAKQ